MKSKEEGMNIAVLALWTADLRTAGRTWNQFKGEVVVIHGDSAYLHREVIKSFVGFGFRVWAVKVDEILRVWLVLIRKRSGKSLLGRFLLVLLLEASVSQS